MRLLKMLFLAIVMVGIVILSLANREAVTVNLLPQGLSDVYVWSMDIPLYLVSLASILTGLMIGYVLEWLRESKHRRMAVEKRREASQLASEVDKLRKQHLSEEDEVLAILETKTKNA